MNRIVLALDTATEACSVALSFNGDIRERYEVAGRDHTQRLMPQLQALMAEAGVRFAQLEGIACGIGPGSFAGVRIGVGMVKGLALALDIPVVGVSSLAMLAQGAVREHDATHVLSVIDARMNEVYVGLYQRSDDGLVMRVQPEQVCAPEAIVAPAVGECVGVGSGWKTYAEVLRAHAPVSTVKDDALPHAQDALRLALPQFAAGMTLSADALVPSYLRDKVALDLKEQAVLRKR